MSAYPQNTASVKLSSQVASGPIWIRPTKSQFYAPASIGLFCTLSSGASLTYSVQVTGDPPGSSDPTNWIDHDVLTGLTASKISNILYACSAIRLNVTAYTSGSVNLAVVFGWP